MEAEKKVRKTRLDVVLRPINRNLTDQEVLELYHSGRGIYVEMEEEKEITDQMVKAIRWTLKCKELIAMGKSVNDIYSYYKKVFGSEGRFDAVEKMQNAKKRKQFICEQVGALMEMGVIYGKTHDVAKLLKFKNGNIETTKRYIRRGKQFFKIFSENIVQSV